MATYDRLAGLPVVIEEAAFEGLARRVSSAFDRLTTVVRLRGAGEEGVGEDVTYDAAEHPRLQALGAGLPLAGEWTLDGFSRHVAALDAFPAGPPAHPVYRHYRRWGFESAALDLALRQAGRPLAAVLEREPGPIRFVVSLRLGEPPSFEPVARRLAPIPTCTSSSTPRRTGTTR